MKFYWQFVDLVNTVWLQVTSFSVDPTLWSKWSDQRKEQHMKRFFEYVAKSSEIYQKSANAGKKR